MVLEEVKWQAPEPAKVGRPAAVDWDAVADKVRKRPGEWALIAEDVSSSAYEALRRRGLETTGRDVADGRVGKLYARYNPEVVS